MTRGNGRVEKMLNWRFIGCMQAHTQQLTMARTLATVVGETMAQSAAPAELKGLYNERV